jgi:hypothetical protein
MSIDPRGPRFVASITTVVLAIVLVTGNVWLLLAQTAVFAIGAFAGIQRNPYSWLFRHTLRPRLAPPKEFEAAAPPRFAQGVGFAFGVAGSLAYFLGADLLGTVIVGLAFAAAFLNAVFGFCLGCEIYLLAVRIRSSRGKASTTTPREVNA